MDSLEGVLRDYAGCLLVVSHDRWVQDQVPWLACTFAAAQCMSENHCVHQAPLLNANDACRSFMDAVADKLFVVEGDGPVRMFDGQFSEVAAHLPVVSVLIRCCVASQAFKMAQFAPH